MKKLFATFSLLFVSGWSHAYSTVFNPFTGKLDYVGISTTSLATNAILNQSTLQSGATFYVSSGTVESQFVIGAGANPQQKIAPTSSPTGVRWEFDTGPVPNVTPYEYVQFTNQSLGGEPRGVNFQNGTGINVYSIDPVSPLLKARGAVTLSSATTLAGEVTISTGIMIGGTEGTSGQCLSSQGPGAAVAWATVSSGGLPLPGGATNYVQITNSLQASSTFYVSSGTVNGKLSVNGTINLPLTSSTAGQVVQNGNPIIHSYGTDNFFIGGPNGQAGNFTLTGTDNYALGRGNLLSLTSGSDNVAIGLRALESTDSGYNNFAEGTFSLRLNTSGHDNVATVSSLQSNVGGYYNVGLNNALSANVGGAYNLGIGFQALNSNTSGNFNTGIGTGASYSQVDGQNNVAIGNSASYAGTSYSNNTAIGFQSGYSNTGGYSLFLGANAGYYDTAQGVFYVNNIKQSTLADDKAYSLMYGVFSSVAGSLTGQKLIINGNLGIGTISPATKLHMSSGTETIDGTNAAIAITPSAGSATTPFKITSSTSSIYETYFSTSGIGGNSIAISTNSEIVVNGSTGTSGQVLTSQGPGASVAWTTVSGGGSGITGLVSLSTGVMGNLPPTYLGCQVTETLIAGSTTTLNMFVGASTTTPCNIRWGDTLYQMTAQSSSTITAGSGDGSARVYWWQGGLYIDRSTAAGLTTFDYAVVSNNVTDPSVSAPVGKIPLATVVITGGRWQTITNTTPFQASDNITAGDGVSVSAGAVAVDSSVARRGATNAFTGLNNFSAGTELDVVVRSNDPSTCNQGAFYYNTSSGTLRQCATANTPGAIVTSLYDVVGSTLGDNAKTGNVGEYLSTSAVTAISFGSTGVWADLVSMSLTAGDWDVSAVLGSQANGATVTTMAVGISSTTGNSTAGLVEGDSLVNALGPTAATDTFASIPNVRVSLSGSKTYYLKYESAFSIATPKAVGRLSARRIR